MFSATMAELEHDRPYRGPADSVFAFLARMGLVADGYRRQSRTRMKASYHHGWSRVRGRSPE